ncbi:MAG: hypothetical protein LBD06_11470 [Candidatus Accumulibacter sp.]|nr:hypothetical protein [Accumulibacter sp.]
MIGLQGQAERAATPVSAAILRRQSVPSSGHWAKRVSVVTWPMPGMPRNGSSLTRQTAETRVRYPSFSAMRFSGQAMSAFRFSRTFSETILVSRRDSWT